MWPNIRELHLAVSCRMTMADWTMHSHVAPYPVQIWLAESHYVITPSTIWTTPTDILSLDNGGDPSVGRHSSFFRINSETDEEDIWDKNRSPLLPAFSDQSHLKVGVVCLSCGFTFHVWLLCLPLPLERHLCSLCQRSKVQDIPLRREKMN